MYKNGKIALASDHGGFGLKGQIADYLRENGVKFVDFGTDSRDSCDYPDFAEKACSAVTSGDCDCAILVCGTGIGMSIAANKIKGIRAACCSDTFSARFTRMHNDANALCLGERVCGVGLALDIVELFITTEFEAGGRHSARLSKVNNIENK